MRRRKRIADGGDRVVEVGAGFDHDAGRGDLGQWGYETTGVLLSIVSWR
jgi:hypothetical protein